MKQTDIIIKHIEKYGYLTTDQAYLQYGIRSLSRRICDLAGTRHAMKAVHMPGTNCVRYVVDEKARGYFKPRLVS